MRLAGVVVSPALQGFHPCDSRAMLLYEQCHNRGMPVFFLGAEPLCRDALMEYAQPHLLDEVARSYPNLRIVISQCGYPWMDEALALETRLGLEVIGSGEAAAGARRFAQGAGRHGTSE